MAHALKVRVPILDSDVHDIGGLLAVGTYRDVDLTRAHPLVETLAELRRQQVIERIALTGLGEMEVAELLGTLTSTAMSDLATRFATPSTMSPSETTYSSAPTSAEPVRACPSMSQASSRPLATG